MIVENPKTITEGLRYSFDLDKDDLAEQRMNANSFVRMVKGLLDSYP
ncbi:MAG: hypothetical protein IJ657_01270 [Acidaminococcaceae bacterium]|nr:hypothetical protein [Acidaminococcaceae bacterium]